MPWRPASDEIVMTRPRWRSIIAGGAVSLRFTGVFPERVSKLVAIEGLGPPPAMIERQRGKAAWERIREWIGSMQGLASRQPRRYGSIEEAAKRMQEVNSFLSLDQARHLTVHGVARNEDGTYSWKFDNYVRAFGPQKFDEQETRELWARIECPTLLMRGTESWATDPSEDGRLGIFQNARIANVEGAGHWVHHDRLDEFLRLTRAFLSAGA